LVPVAARRHDAADGAVVDPLHRLEIPGLMTALRAGGDGEALRLRLVVDLEHLADAGAVDRRGELLLEAGAARVEAILEEIAHRDERDPLRRSQRVVDGARAAAAAADEADADRVAARRRRSRERAARL